MPATPPSVPAVQCRASWPPSRCTQGPHPLTLPAARGCQQLDKRKQQQSWALYPESAASRGAGRPVVPGAGLTTSVYTAVRGACASQCVSTRTRHARVPAHNIGDGPQGPCGDSTQKNATRAPASARKAVPGRIMAAQHLNMGERAAGRGGAGRGRGGGYGRACIRRFQSIPAHPGRAGGANICRAQAPRCGSRPKRGSGGAQIWRHGRLSYAQIVCTRPGSKQCESESLVLRWGRAARKARRANEAMSSSAPGAGRRRDACWLSSF